MGPALPGWGPTRLFGCPYSTFGVLVCWPNLRNNYIGAVRPQGWPRGPCAFQGASYSTFVCPPYSTFWVPLLDFWGAGLLANHIGAVRPLGWPRGPCAFQGASHSTFWVPLLDFWGAGLLSKPEE